MERDSRLVLLCTRVPERPRQDIGPCRSRMDAGRARKRNSRGHPSTDDSLEAGIAHAVTRRPERVARKRDCRFSAWEASRSARWAFVQDFVEAVRQPGAFWIN